MRSAIVAVALLLAVVTSAVALAGTGDPQKKIKPADQARARSIALSAADLGSGWKATKSSSSSTSSDPRCSYYNPDQSDLVENGDYDSPNFTRADGAFVSSTVGIFATAGQARTAYGRVVRPELPRCLGELFAKAITKPSSAKIVSTGSLSFPHYRDRSDTYRVVASVKTPSGTLPVAIDVVLINRGRADVAMIFLGIGKPLPASFERSLAGKVAARLG